MDLENFGETLAKRPYYQALIIYALVLIVCVGDWLFNITGIMSTEQNNPWIIATSFILFFALFNSIICLKAEKVNMYWGISIASFVALLVISALTASLFSPQSMDEAGSFRWLFFVLTFGYLVFLSIVSAMKRIVEFAIRQDKRLHNND